MADGDQGKQPKKTTIPVIVVCLISIALAWAAVKLQFHGRKPSPQLTDFGSHLATLLFAAAFLERAFDVWLSLLFGKEADALDGRIRTLRSKVESQPEPTDDESQKLAELRSQRKALRERTRRLALPALMAGGLILSAVGLRALEPLFDVPGDGEAWSASLQAKLFTGIDIFVTGAVLAGGSDGIHWFVAMYRNWSDKNRFSES
ncbi:MAG: hypothetical protein DWQ01_00885 [Planctomycetota bacterium]|nr:MAG: hypothetical protein DWQ01_00885 [Planctomycetota bacterium]